MHRNLELHAPPYYTTCHLHPEMPEKIVPFLNRTHSFLCSTGNRRSKPAGFLLQKQHHRTSLSEAHVGNQAPEFPLTKAWSPHACNALHYPPGTQTWKAGPRIPPFKALVPSCLQQLLWLWAVQCQQASLRACIAYKLGSLTLAAAALALGSPSPMQVDPRALSALWTPDDSSSLPLLPYRYPQLVTQCQEPATTHLSEPQAPDFASGTRRPAFPQNMETQHSPLFLTPRDPSLPHQSVSARFPN
jgi:hypothetical protein